MTKNLYWNTKGYIIFLNLLVLTKNLVFFGTFGAKVLWWRHQRKYSVRSLKRQKVMWSTSNFLKFGGDTLLEDFKDILEINTLSFFKRMIAYVFENIRACPNQMSNNLRQGGAIDPKRSKNMLNIGKLKIRKKQLPFLEM